MGKFQNYDDYASEYTHTRHAFQWVLDPLTKEAESQTKGSTIVEIGCGTGNYIVALSKELPEYSYKAFDISEEMLIVAKARSDVIEFSSGNADVSFPYPANSIDFLFSVDVIHHIENLKTFFQEVGRTLKPEGLFILVTDSEENIRKRSLSKYFPDILEIELKRYPTIKVLNKIAKALGLELMEINKAEGLTDLDDNFVSKLARKCASSMRLIPDGKHKEGMERIREGQINGEKWISSYSVLKYKKKMSDS